jgi:hypothetical protein
MSWSTPDGAARPVAVITCLTASVEAVLSRTQSGSQSGLGEAGGDRPTVAPSQRQPYLHSRGWGLSSVLGMFQAKLTAMGFI